jgi:hypothetical protein
MTAEEIKEEERKRKARVRSARWVAKNLERVREINRLSYHAHKEKRLAFRGANKEKKSAQDRAYYLKNKERLKEKARKYHEDNRDQRKVVSRAYYQNNKAKCQDVVAKRRAVRMASDPAYRISVRTRCSVNRAIKYGWKKSKRAEELLGCTWEHARKHLEAQFKPGMTWENHSIHGWHIDHIRPLCSFDLTKDDQCMAAFHYTNLQPLWAHENHVKGGRFAQAA